MHSLWFVQWDSTRRDHPGNPGRVSGSGPVSSSLGSDFPKLGNQLTFSINSESCRPLDRVESTYFLLQDA